MSSAPISTAIQTPQTSTTSSGTIVISREQIKEAEKNEILNTIGAANKLEAAFEKLSARDNGKVHTRDFLNAVEKKRIARREEVSDILVIAWILSTGRKFTNASVGKTATHTAAILGETGIAAATNSEVVNEPVVTPQAKTDLHAIKFPSESEVKAYWSDIRGHRVGTAARKTAVETQISKLCSRLGISLRGLQVRDLENKSTELGQLLSPSQHTSRIFNDYDKACIIKTAFSLDPDNRHFDPLQKPDFFIETFLKRLFYVDQRSLPKASQPTNEALRWSQSGPDLRRDLNAAPRTTTTIIPRAMIYRLEHSKANEVLSANRDDLIRAYNDYKIQLDPDEYPSRQAWLRLVKGVIAEEHLPADDLTIAWALHEGLTLANTKMETRADANKTSHGGSSTPQASQAINPESITKIGELAKNHSPLTMTQDRVTEIWAAIDRRKDPEGYLWNNRETFEIRRPVNAVEVAHGEEDLVHLLISGENPNAGLEDRPNQQIDRGVFIYLLLNTDAKSALGQLVREPVVFNWALARINSLVKANTPLSRNMYEITGSSSPNTGSSISANDGGDFSSALNDIATHGERPYQREGEPGDGEEDEVPRFLPKAKPAVSKASTNKASPKASPSKATARTSFASSRVADSDEVPTTIRQEWEPIPDSPLVTSFLKLAGRVPPKQGIKIMESAMQASPLGGVLAFFTLMAGDRSGTISNLTSSPNPQVELVSDVTNTEPDLSPPAPDYDLKALIQSLDLLRNQSKLQREDVISATETILKLIFGEESKYKIVAISAIDHILKELCKEKGCNLDQYLISLQEAPRTGAPIDPRVAIATIVSNALYKEPKDGIGNSIRLHTTAFWNNLYRLALRLQNPVATS